MASQASRRFHEAGVGSRTGLRLSAVARDQDGFEDLEAFYKASQAALDDRQQQAKGDEPSYDQDEDDYDSFDETRFSRRSNVSGVNGRHRPAASSSSMMDIQNSSAPSPRSMLRAARASAAASSSSSVRDRRPHGNITLADDDDEDDFDLPNLSTGSRSFDLAAMGDEHDAENEHTLQAPPTPIIPERGLSARKAGKQPATKAKSKGKEPSAIRRVELSDSEDDRILASIQQRLESEYGDEDEEQDAVSDYEILPVQPSPARWSTGKASTSQSKSPKRLKAAQRRAEERLVPIPTPPAASPPARKRARPAKNHVPEPEPYSAFDLDYDEQEPEPYYSPSRSPIPQAPPSLPPAKAPTRKRGRPRKNTPDEEDFLPASTTSKPPPPPKTAARSAATTSKSTSRPAASTSKAKSRAKAAANEVVQRVQSRPREATVFDENGVRRSTRQRFAPLEYWRGERIRYGRPSLPSGTTIDDLRRSYRPGEDEFEDDPSLMHVRKRVPVLDVKEVIRVPRAPGEGTFSGTTRTRTSTNRRKLDRKSEERTPRLTSATPDPVDDDGDEWPHLDPTADTYHVEDGWDSKTVETGIVVDDELDLEVETSIVRTFASLRPVAAANQEFRFEKLFNCGGLMATGVLELPPGSRKPTKPSQDNSFVFCVLQGALRATVHRKSFIVGPRGIFQVPSGNTYALENICQRDVHLFFAQCRKTKKANAADLSTFTQVSDTTYTPGRGRVLAGVGGFARKNEREEVEEEEAEEQEEEEESEVERRSRATAIKPKSKKPKATAPVYTADSDEEDSGEDDFEISRKVKGKKRVFRKL